MKKQLLLSIPFLAACTSSHAACFAANPLIPPSKHIMVYIGETPEGLRSFGESPFGRKPQPYSPTPPKATTSQENAKLGDADTLELWYFEPNPKSSSQRVCRVDSWVPRKNLGQAPELFVRIKQHGAGSALTQGLLKRELTLAHGTIYS